MFYSTNPLQQHLQQCSINVRKRRRQVDAKRNTATNTRLTKNQKWKRNIIFFFLFNQTVGCIPLLEYITVLHFPLIKSDNCPLTFSTNVLHSIVNIS